MSQKTTLWLSGGLIGGSWLLHWIGNGGLISDGMMIVASLIAGFPVARRAFGGLKYRVIGIELLVTVAVTGALILGEYWEAAAVTFLFLFGAFLEAKTLEKTRSTIRDLMDLSPTNAVVLRDGEELTMRPEEVQRGDRVLVRPGEKIPVDGPVVKGSASVNQATITGESIPVEKSPGASVFSGTVLESGYLEITAEKVGPDTTFARILELVEEAQEAKAPTQQFMERFSQYYTPGIMLGALLVYAITRDVRLTLTLLVIGCPGALVISVPVSIVAGIGNAAKNGVLIKGGHILERAGRIDVAAFDKTGTLTEGRPQVTHVNPVDGVSKDELLLLAARAEIRSEHPLGRAIVAAAQGASGGPVVPAEQFEHLPGMGLSAVVDQREILVGSRKLMAKRDIAIADAIETHLHKEERAGRTAVLVADRERVLGTISVADVIRKDARTLIPALKAMGVKRTVMLTGDNERTANYVAQTLGIDEVHADLMPAEKVDMVQALQSPGQRTAFVGDGVNDAPALAAADLSIAMGGSGTEVAMETADMVLTSDSLERLGYVLALSRATVRNMKQNIYFAVGVVVMLLIGVLAKKVFLASGMLVHELSVLLVILNATRVMKFDQTERARSVVPQGGEAFEL